MNIELNSVEETELFGAKLWQSFPNNGLIFLQGELGAGKTTLVRGILRAAGHIGAVKSPTYTIVEEYDINQQKIFHFDLYRLADPEELEMIGMNDYLAQPSLCFIEWSELGKGFLPEPDMILNLSHSPQGRNITLSIPAKNREKFNTLCWKNKEILL